MATGRGTTVFISFRPDQSEADAGRLRDALAKQLGAERVLMSAAGGSVGRDAGKVLGKRPEPGVLLALIGEKWLDRAGPDGVRRIDDPASEQRLEIAAALKSGAQVIPVLLESAYRPGAAALPRDIARLAGLQPIRLRRKYYEGDVIGLLRTIKAATGGGSSRNDPRAEIPGRKRPGFFRILAALLAAGGLGASLYYLSQQP